MLIPSERSGNPAASEPRRRGEFERRRRWDWTSDVDLDFNRDVFRLPATGETRRGWCPMRNNSDGVSSSVPVFSRFIVDS